MQQKHGKEEKLKNSLKRIAGQEDLKHQRELISRFSSELDISILDCAAALLFLKQPDLSFSTNHNKQSKNEIKSELAESFLKIKRVKYRLDVGKTHKVSLDKITSVLVEVAGVDNKCIGKLDIRNHYTLVELPEGMPADVFQLLSETEIQDQRLNIKRIKYHRRNSKKRRSKT